MTDVTNLSKPEAPQEPSGFILLDKPTGITSFQALYPVKKVFHTRRVGHAGTLDQEASGLIVAAVGKCTRLLSYIEAQDKVYRFVLHLGRETDTLEWTGNILSEDTQGARTGNALEIALKRFMGAQEQIPPQYSAIKIAGHRASDLVRKGQDVEMKPRPIFIHDLELVEYGCFVSPEPRKEFNLRCHCSKGTYIRSLARDIACELGTSGCASGIRRTSIGNIPVERAVQPQQLTLEHLVAPDKMLDWPVLDVDANGIGRLLQGNWIHWDRSEKDCMVFVSAGQRILLAAEWCGNRIVPKFHLV